MRRIEDLGINDVIHCSTEELANKILKMAHELGLKWCTGESFLETNEWSDYKDRSCYALKTGGYCYKEYYEEEGCTIRNAEKTPKTEEPKEDPDDFDFIVGNSYEVVSDKCHTFKRGDIVVFTGETWGPHFQFKNNKGGTQWFRKNYVLPVRPAPAYSHFSAKKILDQIEKIGAHQGGRNLSEEEEAKIRDAKYIHGVNFATGIYTDDLRLNLSEPCQLHEYQRKLIKTFEEREKQKAFEAHTRAILESMPAFTLPRPAQLLNPKENENKVSFMKPLLLDSRKQKSNKLYLAKIQKPKS